MKILYKFYFSSAVFPHHHSAVSYLLLVGLLLAELAAPPRVDGGPQLLQSGGQH